MTALVPASSTSREREALINLTVSQLSSHSQRGYKKAINDFFVWAGVDQRFDYARLVEYRTYLLTRFKGSSANLHISALRKFAETCWLAKGISHEDYVRISKVRGVKSAGHEIGASVTLEQAQALLDAPLKREQSNAKKLRDRALIAVLLGCGVRREEAKSLTVGHFDTFKGTPCLKNIRGKGNRVRTVPMGTWCAVVVRQWLDTRGNLTKDAFLFPATNGENVMEGSISTTSIYEIVSLYRKQVGIDEKITPHALRRTFARLSEAGGVNLRQLQTVLGHVDLRTTELYLAKDIDFVNSPGQCFALQVEADTITK